MGTIVIAIAGIFLFIAVVLFPHLSGKIRHRTNVKASRLKRLSDWFWDPLTWWAKNSIEMTRKIIVKIAKWGRKTRRKLPF